MPRLSVLAEDARVNVTYLDQAKARVPNVPLLINMVSKRVRQLNSGERPLVKPDSIYMDKLDIALKEIAEGKLTAEVVPENEVRAPAPAPSLPTISL
jgi:DNA-directed RNA polymerase subunit omega